VQTFLTLLAIKRPFYFLSYQMAASELPGKTLTGKIG